MGDSNCAVFRSLEDKWAHTQQIHGSNAPLKCNLFLGSGISEREGDGKCNKLGNEPC